MEGSRADVPRRCYGALSGMSSLHDFAGRSEVLIERSIERGSTRVTRSARCCEVRTKPRCGSEWCLGHVWPLSLRSVIDSGLVPFHYSCIRCPPAHLTSSWCFTCKHLCPYRSWEHRSIEMDNDAYIPPNSPIRTSIVLNVDSFAYRWFARECRVWYSIRYLRHVAISLN